MSSLPSQIREHLILVVVLLVCLVVVLVGGHDLSHHAGQASNWTGISHAAMSTAMALGVSVHLVLKAGWIRSTLTHLGSKTPKARLGLFVVDALACGLFMAAMVTGFVIWAQGGRLGGASPRWTAAHHLTVKLFAVAVVVHVVQHRRWIGATVKRIFGAASTGGSSSGNEASPRQE